MGEYTLFRVKYNKDKCVASSVWPQHNCNKKIAVDQSLCAVPEYCVTNKTMGSDKPIFIVEKTTQRNGNDGFGVGLNHFC